MYGVARGLLQIELKQKKLIIYLAYVITKGILSFLTKIQPIGFSRLASHRKHRYERRASLYTDYNCTPTFFSQEKL